MKSSKKAQSIAEYAFLVGLVFACLVGMQVYARRGLQGKIKDMTDAFLHPGEVDRGVYQLARVNEVIPLLDYDETTGTRSSDRSAYSTSTENRVFKNQGDVIVYQYDKLISSQTRIGLLDPSKKLPSSADIGKPTKPISLSKKIPEAPKKTVLLTQPPQEVNLEPSAVDMDYATKEAREEEVWGISVQNTGSGYSASGSVTKMETQWRFVHDENGRNVVDENGHFVMEKVEVPVTYTQTVGVSANEQRDVTYDSALSREGLPSKEGGLNETYSPTEDIIKARSEIDEKLANPASEEDKKMIDKKEKNFQDELGEETD